MKKLISVFLAMLMLCSCVLAESVYVTIVDENGDIAVACKDYDVTDADGDGVVSINDALLTAHETDYEGGAEAGYTAAATDYGMSLKQLWGGAVGDSYGYYVNNASAYSLLDAVQDGDYVAAYAYTDLETWSDTYCFFDCTAIEADGAFELVLTAQTYDASWNPVYVPVAGAMITANGEDTGIVTDAEGKAVISLSEADEYLISAYSAEMTLVPPVCIATIG